MRLEWLEDILAVADTGSFTEAAERRHLTASAFTRRVQQIEDQLGVELFDRTRKPVQLRPTTKINREEIGRLAGALRLLRHQIKRDSEVSGNRTVVATQHALTTAFWPIFLQRMLELNPELYLKLRSANADECFSLLLSRHADIALLYEDPEEPVLSDAPYVERVVVGADTLIPVIGKLHVERINEAIHDKRLPVISYPDDVFFAAVMDKTVLPRLRAQVETLPRAETALTPAALELAVTGVGVAWVPRSLAQRLISSGDAKDLSHLLPSCPLTIVALRLQDVGSSAGQKVWHRFQKAGQQR
ncbi:MAG: LysR family transcriptional regulator [Pseudomonadota bacterium]